jgi:hypothetical protein
MPDGKARRADRQTLFGATGVVFGNGERHARAAQGCAGAYSSNLALIPPIGGATRVMERNGDGEARPSWSATCSSSSARRRWRRQPGFSFGADQQRAGR